MGPGDSFGLVRLRQSASREYPLASGKRRNLVASPRVPAAAVDLEDLSLWLRCGFRRHARATADLATSARLFEGTVGRFSWPPSAGHDTG
jgi:hypothetical protein